jgi:hypothetical protein
MVDNNDVVSRADSLMNRRRSFVARSAAAEESHAEAPPPQAPGDDDDLPVLTEVVAPEAAVSTPPADRFDETLVAILVSDIAHAIEQQLAIELPTLIEASLLTAKEELRAGISATMEIALRDFLARRRQLRLPLQEANSGY